MQTRRDYIEIDFTKLREETQQSSCTGPKPDLPSVCALNCVQIPASSELKCASVTIKTSKQLENIKASLLQFHVSYVPFYQYNAALQGVSVPFLGS